MFATHLPATWITVKLLGNILICFSFLYYLCLLLSASSPSLLSSFEYLMSENLFPWVLLSLSPRRVLLAFRPCSSRVSKGWVRGTVSHLLFSVKSLTHAIGNAGGKIAFSEELMWRESDAFLCRISLKWSLSSLSYISATRKLWISLLPKYRNQWWWLMFMGRLSNIHFLLR